MEITIVLCVYHMNMYINTRWIIALKYWTQARNSIKVNAYFRNNLSQTLVLFSVFKIASVNGSLSFAANNNVLNSLRPRRNRRHFADDIFKCILLNENEWISLRISLKFVPKVRINNIPSLVQIMAWRWPGDKPLSELMVVSLLTHICVTRPQWVNISIRYFGLSLIPLLVLGCHWIWNTAE